MIAPYAAPKLAEIAGPQTTFVVSAVSAVLATVILTSRRGTLGRFASHKAAPPTAIEIAEGETLAD